MRFFAEQKTVIYDPLKEEIKLTAKSAETNMLDFFSSMSQVFLDSYYIVLMALHQLAGKNIAIKRKLLIRELGWCVKSLHSQKVIPHVHSGLKDILSTALSKYADMELIKIHAYGNSRGSTT